MGGNMIINKKFFSYFQGFDTIKVANEVLNLDDNSKNIILSIWGKNPKMKYNVQAENIIFDINTFFNIYFKINIYYFIKMVLSK